MNRRYLLLFLSLLFIPAHPQARQHAISRVLNLQGQIIGTLNDLSIAAREGPAFLNSRKIKTPAGVEREIASGLYFVVSQEEMLPRLSGNEPGFADITSTVLPQREWDAGAIRTGDVNGDGREDIVFSRYTVLCDSVGAEDRPRIWIQTASGTFVDETDARVPPIIAPADDMLLFDADADGDRDIFLRGYSCAGLTLTAALLINDGTGHFTDESSTRLPSATGGISGPFVMRAAYGFLDGDRSNDLVVTIWGTDTVGGLPSHPEVWLNDGSGHFMRDTLNRIEASVKYGYFAPFVVHINPDSLPDILYANIGMVNIPPDSATGDTISGQTSCFRNTGNGFFTDETRSRIPDATNLSARLLAPIDADNDGAMDFLEIHFPSPGDPHQISLFRNSGSGIFSETPGAISDTITGWFNAAAVAPFDRDRFPDVYLGRVFPGADATDIVLVNNGDGTLKDVPGMLPGNIDFTVSCDTMDLGHKGAPDIVVGNYASTLAGKGQNRFYFNRLHGSPWTVKETGLDVQLNDVLMLDSTHAIVVGGEGTVAMTDDAGKSWDRKTTHVSSTLNVIRAWNSSTFYVGGDSVLLISTDAGSSWNVTRIDGEVTTLGLAPAWVGYDVFLGRKDGVLMKGAGAQPSSWTEYRFGGGGIVALGFGPGIVNGYSVLCVSRSKIYSSVNEGMTWDSAGIGGLTFWDEIRSGDLSHVPKYLAGGGGDFAVFPLVLRAYDSSWTRLDLGSMPTGVFDCVRSVATTGDVYVCGWNGMMYRSDDSGATWTRQLTGTTSELRGMSFIDEQHGVAVGSNGTVLWLDGMDVTGADDGEPVILPERFVLEQNYPNPFNPSTTISFVLDHTAPVSVKIYDLLGREVGLLVDEVLPPGRYERVWNASGQASGVYYYRLSSGSRSVTRKLLLVR